MSSWTVVEFIDTNTVEAVPTKWISGDKCYWPPLSRFKTVAEIKSNVSPNLDWPLYNMRVFKDATFGNKHRTTLLNHFYEFYYFLDDYMIARNKAKKAEVTSDLNSDGEKKLRKLSKKKCFDSDSDAESGELSQLPPPPVLSFKSKTRK